MNHGAVSQSWTSTTGPDPDGTVGLLRELSRLRTDLKEARRRDQIDDFTFRAADEELQTAEQNAETRHEAGRGRLLRALMSLRGSPRTPPRSPDSWRPSPNSSSS